MLSHHLAHSWHLPWCFSGPSLRKVRFKVSTLVASLLRQGVPLLRIPSDFISALQTYVRAGRGSFTTGLETKYLESTSFWKEAYEKSEAARMVLQDQVYNLEEVLETTKGQRPSGHHTPGSKIGQKRKRDFDAPVKSGSDAERRATPASMPSIRGLTSFSKIPPESDVPEEVVGGGISTLMRRFYNVNHLASQRRLDNAKLASSIAEFSSEAESLLAAAVAKACSKPIHNVPDTIAIGQDALPSICTAIGRCLPTLLHAHKRLGALPPLATNSRYASYTTIRLLSSTMVHLNTVSMCLAGQTCHSTKAKPAKHRKLDGSRSSTQTGQVDEQHMRALHALADILHRSFQLLSVAPAAQVTKKRKQSQAQCRDILQALLCGFLNHLGQVLATFVFASNPQEPDQHQSNHSKSGSVFDPHIHSRRMSGLHSYDTVENGVAFHSASLQARPLVQVLRQAMQVVDGSPALLDKISTGQQGAAHGLGKVVEPQTQILHRLQNTLLKGVFGHNEEAFKESLGETERQERPSKQAEEYTTLENEEMVIGEWFTREVWTQVGWDVLVKQLEDLKGIMAT